MIEPQRNGNKHWSGTVTGSHASLPRTEVDMGEHCLRVKLASFGKLLHRRGYVSGTNGNLSVRLGPETVLITPSGVCKRFMTATDMIVVTLSGKKVSGPGKPSSEIGVHLRIYKLRPDVAAVVHAHPVVSTALATAGVSLIEPVCAELVSTLGQVPLAPYALPGSAELVHALEPFIPGHNAILMQNHGVVTCGETIERAYLNMETVEHCAKTLLVSKLLGQPRLLSNYEVEQLLAEAV